MATETLNGAASVASIIVVADAAGIGDYDYLIGTLAGAGSADDLVINGGIQGDTIELAGVTSLSGIATLTVNAGNGNDTVVGSAIGDFINGDANNDSLSGGDGDDTLRGGDGVDALVGGLGNDQFRIGQIDGQGEVFNGGGGSDTIVYENGGQPLQFQTVGDANFLDIEVLNGGGQFISGNVGDNLLDFSAIATAVNVTRIDGNGGADTIVAFGNTALYVNGASGADRIQGNGLAESLDGGTEADTVDGGSGNDTLRGGDGVDSLLGGIGNDQFRIGQVDGQGDIFNGGSGSDTIAYENGGQALQFLTVGDANFLGIEVLNGGGTFISGNVGDNLLDFSAIATAVNVTRIDGNSGADTIVAFGNTALYVNGAAGADRIQGNGLAESLDGGTEADTVDGGSGNDTLRGGDGVDSLLGGIGNDQFRIGQVDGQGDIFNGGSGSDTIAYENGGQPLQFLTVGDANFLGIEVLNGGGTFISGNVGDNLLDFSAIATAVNVTRIDGNSGADTIVAFGATAVLINGGAGNDLITGNLRGEVLNGDAGLDTITGGGGADTLDGGADADRLAGGTGDDLYLVDSGDVITEGLDGGRDTVVSGLTRVLGLNFEELVLTGAAPINGTGNALDNRITGNDGANLLFGLAGDDTLEGGAGVDRLFGGLDNDLYIFTTGDVVTESLNSGTDTVQAATNFTLGSNFEALRLTGAAGLIGTGNLLNNLLVGGDGADTLNGVAGNDTLDGGAGVDRLLGGGGDDLYLLRNGDVVVEGANLGTDTVSAFGVVNVVLAANVEVLVLGDAGVLTGTGNGSANTLVGNGVGNTLGGLGGADLLEGNAGNDTLIGGLGADTLDGGAGADRYVFNTTAESTLAATDRITAFGYSVGSLFDRIDLSGIDANIFVQQDQAFIYRGPAPFSGVGPLSAGELRVVLVSPGVYRASGDTTGDGVAEFALDIVSATPPTSGWFLL
ncbi:calcium-binding protein [Roseomonas sp. CECT 9278]|uniref:beta strand repeat-containing protein n=1 Tax=Roseomonas sp. CECT 9278 TaxID=2845823 RepID=UPI001E57F143|nr:calcium-binding protein [Roseomonas sp. CECT 9278]CAH0302499.1 hypothetical protein ROS9278_04603 [Roseomonas sp. CECT 9278]